MQTRFEQFRHSVISKNLELGWKPPIRRSLIDLQTIEPYRVPYLTDESNYENLVFKGFIGLDVVAGLLESSLVRLKNHHQISIYLLLFGDE